MPSPATNPLDEARRAVGLSQADLWMRYFGLGGMTDAFELEAILQGLMVATSDDHNRIAHALNERFTELGGNHPVAYSED